MSDLLIASIISGFILLASIISTQTGIAAAIIEILFGVITGNVLHINTATWISFLASFGSIILIFLAGTEVNMMFLKKKWKTSSIIGGLSFLIPAIIIFIYLYFFAHWSLNGAKIGGIALAATSFAVVYTILVETGLSKTELGKILMVATFITDFGSIAAISFLFLEFNVFTLIFIIFSIIILLFGPNLIKYIFQKFSGKIVESEIKLLFFLLFLLMFLGELGKSYAFLPVFLFGIQLSNYFNKIPGILIRLRRVSFAFITPLFFIHSGMKLQFLYIIDNWLLIIMLLGILLAGKILVIGPSTLLLLPKGGRLFLTLLLSTGLTIGIVITTYGNKLGYIDTSQFSILLSVIILSAVIPTIIAQRFFMPLSRNQKDNVLALGEEG